MAPGKVLLTGATGFLGSAILIDILKAGYEVNIAVRSESKAKFVREAPAIASLGKDSACKYFIVPDLTTKGCLDEAAAGTDLIIHCANPMPSTEGDPEKNIIIPAVECTLRALESAQKAGTVKRVIILSSVGAFAGPELVGGTYIPPEEILIGEKINDYFGPPFVNPLVAYCAAKTAALKRSLEWMEKAVAEGTVNFDLINLAPNFIFGKVPLATSVKEFASTSNSVLLRMITGAGRSPDGKPGPPTMCGGLSVDDFVKTAHKSLDLDGVKTPSSGPSKHIATYVISSKFEWNDVFPIIARKWPEEVKKGILAGEGDYPSKPRIGYAMEEFRKTFGFAMSNIETILDGFVPSYLEILEKDKSSTAA
ncbi:NAD dependent epimerase/dehydratase [Diaporthe helianthi]|uniref:NAD dependent epimerase/dehydratase n=1 Tax=Diaporthe helianthi TaxID=158607 RepID=A0A2P5IFA3_DIAHE|nr:NAD dependent epimerase/dehydratase [Diaporthe helianthi]